MQLCRPSHSTLMNSHCIFWERCMSLINKHTGLTCSESFTMRLGRSCSSWAWASISMALLISCRTADRIWSRRPVKASCSMRIACAFRRCANPIEKPLILPSCGTHQPSHVSPPQQCQQAPGNGLGVTCRVTPKHGF